MSQSLQGIHCQQITLDLNSLYEFPFICHKPLVHVADFKSDDKFYSHSVKLL